MICIELSNNWAFIRDGASLREDITADLRLTAEPNSVDGIEEAEGEEEEEDDDDDDDEDDDDDDDEGEVENIDDIDKGDKKPTGGWVFWENMPVIEEDIFSASVPSAIH